MLRSTLQRKLNRVIADPTLIITRLRQAIYGVDAKKRKSINLVSATLDERLAEIAAQGHERVLVFGDFESATMAKGQLTGANVVWISGDFTCIANGAKLPLSVDMKAFDAILVTGPNVATDFRFVVRALAHSDLVPRIYWVSNSFEFCAGTVPILEDCGNAEITVYNHFADMFGVWDPLYVRVEAFDQESSIVRYLILPPKEAFRVRLSELLPKRKGPACVFHSCQHPRLTNQRHYRWRSTTVYRWRDSAAMVHSDGDFRDPSVWTEFKLGCGLLHSGNMVITLPNYNRALKDEDNRMDVLSVRKMGEVHRRTDVRIDDLRFEKMDDAAFDEYFGVRYRGSGGSFWFALDEGNGATHNASIAANHAVRASLRPNDETHPSPDQDAFRLQRKLRDSQIIPDPHGVPVTLVDSPIEFGFEFDANVPVLRKFDLRLFSLNGEAIAESTFEKPRAGPIFTSEVISSAGWESKNAGLLIVSPDWLEAGIDPAGRGAAGNLVARHRKTLDWDATEFQGCWRNVGVRIEAFPHWLSQDRMLVGRTNLLCGLAGIDEDTDVAISILNGSGNAAYNVSARTHISVVAPDGREASAQIILSPFECATVWLDDVIHDWRDHLNGDFGTILVKSGDADLNANLVTTWNDRSVSLQHMWGY